MSELTAKAQELLANRLTVIEQLEEATAEDTRSKQQLRDAESSQPAVWSNALNAGWTKAELRQLTLSAPPAKRGGRPSGSRNKRLARSASDAAVASRTSTPSEQ